MKKTLLILSAILFFSILNIYSQDTTLIINNTDSTKVKKSPFSFNADIMSRYVWRGINLGGNAPSIQPTIKYSIGNKKHSLTIGSWGAYSVGGTQIQECDLFLNYTIKEVFTISVSDYFFPADDGSSVRYGNLYETQTGHVLEGGLLFNGTEKIPFTLLFAMNFLGMDARKINTDGTKGDIFMSKYIELGYKKEWDDLTMNLFIGGVIEDPNEEKGEIGYYGNYSNGIINVGCKLLKEIKISKKHTLPVHSQLILNPERERIFMVIGVTL